MHNLKTMIHIVSVIIKYTKMRNIPVKYTRVEKSDPIIQRAECKATSKEELYNC